MKNDNKEVAVSPSRPLIGSTSPLPEPPDGVCNHCGCPYYFDIAQKVKTRNFKQFCAPSCEARTARVIIRRQR